MYQVRSISLSFACARTRPYSRLAAQRIPPDTPFIYNTYEYLRGIGGYSGMPAHIEIRRASDTDHRLLFLLLLSFPSLLLLLFPSLFLLPSTLPFDRITGRVPGPIESLPPV